MRNRIKGFIVMAALLLTVVFSSISHATDDVWTAATTAMTTTATNVTALLVVAVGIGVAFLGYKFVKKTMNRA